MYHLPINGVNAYPCNRLLNIFGYFWASWYSCATLVFSNKKKISHRHWGPLHGSSSPFLAVWASEG